MCMCVLKNRLLHYTQSVAQHGLYILNLLPMLMIKLNVASKATKLDLFPHNFLEAAQRKITRTRVVLACARWRFRIL